MRDDPEQARRDGIADLLARVEREMRALSLWEEIPPSPERMASDVPFCHDTLEFTQWVQWIFVPRFRALLEGDLPLPTACAISPAAEIALADFAQDPGALIEYLRAIDAAVTGQ